MREDLKINKIGLVSRDYNVRFPNGYRDFSYSMPDILTLLDAQGCDAVLFSLYSLVPRPDFDPYTAFKHLKTIRLVCIEEFMDKPRGRKPGACVAYYKDGPDWRAHRVKQVLGRVNTPALVREAQKFAQKRLPKRVLGNCALLICGEVNLGRYAKLGDKQIHDVFGVRAALPPTVNIILNAGHDKTQRFELPRKRSFFSAGRRLVITVWNKGKIGPNGMPRREAALPWSAYFDGEPVAVTQIANGFGVDIGIVNIDRLDGAPLPDDAAASPVILVTG